MPRAMSRTLEICEPMWKCSSFSASPMPASRSDFHRSSSWRGLRPNLALSPPEFCHLPAPSDARRMRTPRIGSTPSALASSITSRSSDGFSTTMKVFIPSLRPISARRMYSRSLRSEEHTSELQSSMRYLVCRLLLEKKNHQSEHVHNDLHLLTHSQHTSD